MEPTLMVVFFICLLGSGAFFENEDSPEPSYKIVCPEDPEWGKDCEEEQGD